MYTIDLHDVGYIKEKWERLQKGKSILLSDDYDFIMWNHYYDFIDNVFLIDIPNPNPTIQDPFKNGENLH